MTDEAIVTNQSTAQVREVMKQYSPYAMYTRKNKTHRTVKGIFDNRKDLDAVNEELVAMGYVTRYTGPMAAVIVRVDDMMVDNQPN